MRFKSILKKTAVLGLIMLPFSSFGVIKLEGIAYAQIPMQSCYVTQIYQPGVGWIAGSEKVECDIIGFFDPSPFYIEGSSNQCGVGNPCLEPPTDDESSDEDLQCMAEQSKESDIDKLANEIANEIKGLGYNRIEYGSVIYSHPVDGYRRDGLDTGNSEGVTYSVRRRSGETVVALVHNHPRDGGSGASDDDWDGARPLFDASVASESNFSIYVLSADTGKLAEFDALGDQNVRSARGKHINDAKGEC